MDKPQFIHQIFWWVTCLAKTLSFRERKSSHQSCQRSVSPPRTNRIDPDPIICPLTCEVLSDLVYCSYIHITSMVKTERYESPEIYSTLNHEPGLSQEDIHKFIRCSWWPSPWRKILNRPKEMNGPVQKYHHPIHDVSNHSPAHNPSSRWCNCHIVCYSPTPRNLPSHPITSMGPSYAMSQHGPYQAMSHSPNL